MVDRFGNWYQDYPGQQPHQDPAYVRMYGQQQPMQQAQQPAQQQMMTPPTINAQIIQVDSVEAIDRIPLTPGSPQMFWTKDEQTILVRTMYVNGQHTDDIWDKRPPAPPAPTLNPAEYIRREELPALIAEVMQAQTTPRKTAKKEDAA